MSAKHVSRDYPVSELLQRSCMSLVRPDDDSPADAIPAAAAILLVRVASLEYHVYRAPSAAVVRAAAANTDARLVRPLANVAISDAPATSFLDVCR